MRTAVALSRGRGRGALPRQAPLGQVSPIPAPVAGWDAATPLAEMAITSARLMVNFWPQPDSVTLRKGHEGHATGIGDDVETVMPYGDTKLFAAGNSTIWDVTSAGAAVSAQGGFTNTRFQWTNYATTAGPFLAVVNGADSLQIYDGTDWSAPSITGTASSTFIGIAASKRRLWACQVDEIDAWYGPTGAIAGAFTRYPLGGEFPLGGALQAIGNWTRDGGGGLEDLTCFFSDQGEVAIYTGYDPTDAAIWQKVGTYRIGKPIGRRCLTQVGGELAVLTEFGLQPMSSALQQDTAQQAALAVTQRIGPAIAEFARLYGTNFGWEALTYPRMAALVINVPISTTLRHDQCVMNLRHGAWTRFQGWNAVTFGVFGGRLYFGGTDGTVYLADEGASDGGTAIAYDVQTADTSVGAPFLKSAQMVRAVFLTNGSPAPTIETIPDFGDQIPEAVASEAETDYALWDVALWDDGLWAPEFQTYAEWQSVVGIGTTFSLRMRLTVTGLVASWVRWDFRSAPGAGVNNV